MNVQTFYDQLTPFYQLIYPNWETSMQQQAQTLTGIIRDLWGDRIETVLDVACGIGTQALGLAQHGFTVTASDLSPQAITRARQEAASRQLKLDFSVADMQIAFRHHRRQFDLVIACDNAVPHLLTDTDILTAFRQFYHCTRPGGGCLISVRDYARGERGGVQVKPYGLRQEGSRRYLVFQVWEFHGEIYELAMYFVQDEGGVDCTTHVMRTHYYAVTIDKLMALLAQAGFEQVQRVDDRFFQPVIVGQKPDSDSLC